MPEIGRSFRLKLLLVAAVACAMEALFLLPASVFVPATFVATGVMVVCAWKGGAIRRRPVPSVASLLLGAASAAVLYLVFLGGNAGISAFPSLGLKASSEASIYSLVSSPSDPRYLELVLLMFDAVGYETFFRGFLQRELKPRMGLGAAPAVALFDAALHIATLNPLWVATTFVADLCWGLTYHAKGLASSTASHFIWDVAVFILFPI